MKVAILETVKATAGFELEYDRIIIETLKKLGHEPIMLLPEKTDLGRDFGVPISYLPGGEIVSYEGAGKLKKIWLSLLREGRRVKWFDACIDVIEIEKIEAVLITTATYRYLRALKKSKLRNSPVPIKFMFLGVNPGEKPKFLDKAKACTGFKNIQLFITTLRDDFCKELPENTKLILPPVMVPESCPRQDLHEPMKIGFFGHYRQGDKNLDLIFSAIESCSFKRDVQFVVQLVPTTDKDREDVDAIVNKYQGNGKISFITRALIGDDWYNGIQSVDVVFLPYTAERYLYNWSAIYFTAIGCYKPVLTTSTLNPEVMQEFDVGEIVNLNEAAVFSKQLESFVNDFADKNVHYQKQLKLANRKYSKEGFIKTLLKE